MLRLLALSHDFRPIEQVGCLVDGYSTSGNTYRPKIAKKSIIDTAFGGF